MSSTLSAQQMADHAAAYEQIKRRPITSEEMLHIGKLHQEGEGPATAGSVSLDPAAMRMGGLPAEAPQPSQSAPLDFAGEAPAFTGQADPASSAPLDFAGDTPPAGAAAGAAPMSPDAMYAAAAPAEAPVQSAPQPELQEPAYQKPGSIKDLAYKADASGDDLFRRADQRDQEATALGNAAQAENDDAALNLTQATIESNKATSEEYDKLSAEAGKTEARLNEVIAQGEQTAAKQMERVQLASATAASTEMKDFFADKSTAGKILAIISQSLAGGANYLAGQPGAPTPLDKFIADDVHRQTVNLGLKKDNAAREKDLLEQAYKATGSRIAAQAAVTDAAYAKADAAMKAAAARMNTPQAIAAYQKAHAQSLQKRAELAQKSADALRDDASKTGGQAGKLLSDMQKNADKRNALADKQKAQDAFQLEDVETPPGTPNSFKERLAKKVIEPAKEVLSAVDDLQRINKVGKDRSFERWSQTTQAQAALKVLEKNRANFGGALSAGETTLLEALSGGESLQKYAQFFNSPAYAEALARLGVRVKQSVASSMSYQGMRVRPDSVFYLKHAERQAPDGTPAMLERPGAAAKRQPAPRMPTFVGSASDTDDDGDTAGDTVGDADG